MKIVDPDLPFEHVVFARLQRFSNWVNSKLVVARHILAEPLAVVGILGIVALLLCAVFAGLLSPYDPLAQNLALRLMPPSSQHWFGTDQLGRDVFSRILYGSRLTLSVVAASAMFIAPVGVLLGVTAGYFGGLTDRILSRMTDVFMAFPRLLLALSLSAALGAGVTNSVVAIVLSSWPSYARQARTETLTLRQRDFVRASQMIGASHIRILFQHMLPLVFSSAFVRLTLDLAGIILMSAGLGFLGLGARPPAPEWGAMVADGRDFLSTAWWIAAMPGGAICVASLFFNLLGDGVRDALDPRARR
ncbi:ABC transporter permease [Burkholderia cepacia]|uniref:ABC transporter permease n=1 Tax=Burkholderia cepacia TaxID=292 RepID=UPI001F25C280|nr:ABC transporter permease [Burkholderia cepacia]MCE4124419.1 ABC transporter permease [Burkholderia cepacia]